MILDNIDIEHKEWFRPGMGTENVGPFLQSLIGLTRPKRVLEIGVGYTTPFLIEGIIKNSKFWVEEINANKKYVEENINKYDSKMVIIDDNWLGKSIGENIKNKLEKCPFLEIVKDKFQGKSKYLLQKYGKFDFVWFDCGGRIEYTQFLKEYWELCSEYVIFHYTYSDGKPNDLLAAILENIGPPCFRLDIVEPHKSRQGSITVLRKAKEIFRIQELEK
jgi:hypothetical protein